MRGIPRRSWALAGGVLASACLVGCGGHRVLTPELHAPEKLPDVGSRVPLLKVHMRSGELYTLSEWRATADGARIEGFGTRYSVSRAELGTGPVSIGVDEVALLETNRAEKVGRGSQAVLAIMTTLTGALAAYCATNPKSCFGSCPTFYLEGGERDRPAAEGFSASIARALEARDVDALGPAPSDGRPFVLTMRNEAFETHAVRSARLLAVERPPGGRVLAGVDGRYYPATDLVAPSLCRAAEGDCLEAVRAADGHERDSAADAHDLATREVLEVAFPPAEGGVGLVLRARQTLLSTHLFYQTMAFFGSRAGEYLAALERGGPEAASRAMGMARVLGGIEAEVSESAGPWRSIGTFDEPGPIAGDTRVLPFEAGGGALRIRLRQAKGHWRLDQVALARLGAPAVSARLDPVSVRKGGRADDRALSLLRRTDRHLVALPGDAYRLAFDLPPSRNGLELFLESEGYYYEWMREEWLAEEDPAMAALVLADPAEALRRMAGPFKRHEAELERAFWASRFRR